MEPAKSSIKFEARVLKVEEKFTNSYVQGFGKDATFRLDSLGWFIYLEGSRELLHVGAEKPNIDVGDIATVRITFNAKPVCTSK